MMQLPADRTSVALLRRRAQETPDRRAFLYLSDGETEGEQLTYGDLDVRCRALAARLQRSGLAGERVLLLYPPGLDFIVGFLACLYAGVVAVPLYLPDGPQAAERVAAIAADAEARAALTNEGSLALLSRYPVLTAIESITDAGTDASSWTEFDPEPEALAFLQYTSGSTSAPKGVMLTHANIMGNQAAIHAASRQGPDSVFLSWLPLHHDMGLMGMVIQPIYVGAPCVLMPPRAFLRRPARWLQAISRYRATISGGPNFAFDLCVSRVADAERDGLDLSSWDVAYNGAEPVSAETMRRFAETFEANGLAPHALYPCYGLAEATAFFTGGDRTGLQLREFDGRTLVGCGRPHAGHRISIIDSATGLEADAGQVGEIWLAGPSVGLGYWNRPDATAEAFVPTLANGSAGPWLRTGDLGFERDGELVVCGRLKDLVIIRGRNHYPQDLEMTVRESHPILGLGEGAAFTVDRDGEERLCLVHEVKPSARAQAGELLTAIRQAIATQHGVRPEAIALIKWGSLPKTSSGKVQRSACRAAYLAGTLDLVELERRIPVASEPASVGDP